MAVLRKTTILKWKVAIERNFDVDLRAHPRVQDLCDQELKAIPPNFLLPDNFVFTLRDTEYLKDTSTFSKLEAPSLFQVFDFEPSTGRAHAVFVGPSLRAVGDTSRSLNKPLADVHIVKSTHAAAISLPEADEFIPIVVDPELYDTKLVSDLLPGISFTATYWPEEVDYSLNAFKEENLYQLYRTALESACLPIVLQINTSGGSIDIDVCYQITCLVLAVYSGTYNFKITPIRQRTSSTSIQYLLAVDGEAVAVSGTPANPFAPWGEVEVPLYLERGLHVLTFRSNQRNLAGAPAVDPCILKINDQPFSVQNAYTAGLRLFALPLGDPTMKLSLVEELLAPSAIDSMELADALALDFPVLILIRAGSEALTQTFAQTKVYENNLGVGKLSLNESNEILNATTGFQEFPRLDRAVFKKILEAKGIDEDPTSALIMADCFDPCGDCGSGVEVKEGAGVMCSSNEAYILARTDDQPLSFHELSIFVQLPILSTNVTIFVEFAEPNISPGEIVGAIAETNVDSVEIDIENPGTIRLNATYPQPDLGDDLLNLTVPALYTLKFKKQIKCQKIKIYTREVTEEPNGSFILTDNCRINAITRDYFGEYCLAQTRSHTQKLIDATGALSHEGIDLEDIAAIPALFKPENLRGDMKLTDYIIFGIRGPKPDYSQLGVYYKLESNDEKEGAVTLSFHQTPVQKTQKGVYADIHRTTPLPWAFALFDHATGEIQPSDMQLLRIEVTNEGDTAVTNPTFEIFLPNYGQAWTAPGCYTCGITKAGEKTTSPTDWSWVRVTYQGTVDAGASITLDFTPGDFSAVENVGDELTQSIFVRPLTSSLHAVLVKSEIRPGENTFYLFDDPGTPNLAETYELIKKPIVGRLFVQNTCGYETPFEIHLDLAEMLGRFGRVPLEARNARTKEPLEIIGLDEFGVPTKSFLQWKGTRVAIKGVAPQEGLLIDLIPGDFSQDEIAFMGDTIVGLLALYHMGAQNLLDASGRNWHGELRYALPVDDKNGNAEQATQFTGGSFGVIPHLITAPTFSVSLWVNTSALDTGILCASKDLGPGGDTDFDLYLEGGVLKHDFKGETLSSETTIADGEFHHIVVSMSPVSGRRIYIDGELKAWDQDGTKYTGLGPDYVCTVAGYAKGLYFDGVLDELRLYARDLAPPIVKHLYRIYDLHIPKRTMFTWRDFQNDGLLILRPVGTVTSLYDRLETTGQAYWIYKYAGIPGVVKQLVE